LQVLNNPYVAMAKADAAKHTHAYIEDSSSFSASGNGDLPRSVPPSRASSTTGLLSRPQSRFASIQPSSAASSMRITSTFSEELLDPSLRSASHQPNDILGSQPTGPEDSDTSSSDESSADDEDVDDGDDDDNECGGPEFGWAEVGERHSAHPGE
jgi:hypothetical protein